MCSAARNKNPKNKRGGFTLVELLLVLGLAAAAFALILPLGLRLQPDSNPDRAAETVLAELQHARARAMRLNQPVTLQAGDIAAPAGYRLLWPESGVDFAPDGFSSGATLLLEGEAGQRRLRVAPVSGRAYIQ
ncbi:GspH/FimT family protein [Ferrovibrio sp.]|uniref:GspH/FimT family protein n=1 Tax=Ferrovibrio sp. TaxID=1917215 RepID=UPI0025B89852|nr:GspH/FimT family protein [Ferrovibrio sp.]MBX3456027.1 prepilin-type N-terminal cleavage/methylation domain-containing protein [Ferrovibrio sp.]